MMAEIFEGVDRMLRSVAFDILCQRDGLSGWHPKREEFLSCLRKDRKTLEWETKNKLQKILMHAYETTPYYRDLFTANAFTSFSSFELEHLLLLPFLTKDIIKEKKFSLISTCFERTDLDLSYTGGTTGTQTSFYRDRACTISRVGRQLGVLDLCGYRPGIRRGVIWGVHDDLVRPEGARSLKARFRKYANNDEVLPCTVMNEELMADYYRRLRSFRPEVLYGYPSAMCEFGAFIDKKGLAPVEVKKIMTTAERLNDFQRNLLQRVFGGEVFNLYCTREYGCIGFECKQHEGFHIDTQSVYVEIIKNGRCAAAGEEGEITVTDLLNYGMPLIRSRTGDMGTLSPEPCKCGSPLPVLKGLDGRATDFLFRPDGAKVAGLMLSDLFADIPSLRCVQFVQESLCELCVFVVTTAEFTDDVEKEVIRQIRGVMGSAIAIHINRVPRIARSARSGKLREVICTIGQQ